MAGFKRQQRQWILMIHFALWMIFPTTATAQANTPATTPSTAPTTPSTSPSTTATPLPTVTSKLNGTYLRSIEEYGYIRNFQPCEQHIGFCEEICPTYCSMWEDCDDDLQYNSCYCDACKCACVTNGVSQGNSGGLTGCQLGRAYFDRPATLTASQAVINFEDIFKDLLTGINNPG